MLNLNNPLNNTIIVFTIFILVIYISKPNMFINEQLEIVYKYFPSLIILIPIIIYLIFIMLKNNNK